MSSEEFDAEPRSISEFFAGKLLTVPDYQRPFSWTRENWRELWDDIVEAWETDTTHYWGTLTLRRTDDPAEFSASEGAKLLTYDVVDGQQRLTTLYLLFFALHEQGTDISAVENRILFADDGEKLSLGGPNRDFLQGLVYGKNPAPESKTNRLLSSCLQFFRERSRTLSTAKRDELTRFVLASTYALEFIVSRADLAVRAFQSLNDRGKPLTLIDKTKSFLMFWALRYLDGRLLDFIKRGFSEAVLSFDRAKELAESEGYSYLHNYFSEDDLMLLLYHYSASYLTQEYDLEADTAYDYDLSAEGAYSSFVKGACKSLATRPDDLEPFLKTLVGDLRAVSEALKDVAERGRNRHQLQSYLQYLDTSNRVFPLLPILEVQDLLTSRSLAALETLDLRVYKIRGTDPRADLYRDTVSQVRKGISEEDILSNIEDFTGRFMSDNRVADSLMQPIYGNPATKYILWEYERQFAEGSSEDLDYGDFQIEHILPDNSTVAPERYGCEDEEEYGDLVDRLGNLCLLEEPLNKGAGQVQPKRKTEYYLRSDLAGTRSLGHHIEESGFGRDEIDERTVRLCEFAVSRWNL